MRGADRDRGFRRDVIQKLGHVTVRDLPGSKRLAWFVEAISSSHQRREATMLIRNRPTTSASSFLNRGE